MWPCARPRPSPSGASTRPAARVVGVPAAEAERWPRRASARRRGRDRGALPLGGPVVVRLGEPASPSPADRRRHPVDPGIPHERVPPAADPSPARAVAGRSRPPATRRGAADRRRGRRAGHARGASVVAWWAVPTSASPPSSPAPAGASRRPPTRGTTVASEAREIRTRVGRAILVDLPGAGSLADRPVVGPAFWHALLAAAPDAILVIADAGDVVRHLPLVLACRDLGLPVVLALNLADEAAARGVHVDTGRLAQLLAVPVRRTVARSGTGVAAAVSLAVARARRRQGVRAGPLAPLHRPGLALRAGCRAGSRGGRGRPPDQPPLGAAALDPSGLGRSSPRAPSLPGAPRRFSSRTSSSRSDGAWQPLGRGGGDGPAAPPPLADRLAT